MTAEVIGLAGAHPDPRRRMEIRVLGHIEASIADRPLALGGAKQRAVLAMLGLEANRPVTADRLIEGLWGEEPPASAAKMVQHYVWRLRKALADEDAGAEIVTRGRAYELRIDRDQVDACRLERLVGEATRAAESGHAGGAAREALALFHGDPLADVAQEPFAGAEIRRLDELRLTAAELAIDADLAAGHGQEVVAEVDALLAENPLRERLHAQRMLSLYRAGRQAEALEAYREARSTLVEQIGVEPGPELRRLHDAILRQDPALDVAPPRAQLPPELETAATAPLAGRVAELGRLRALWRRGPGLVTLAGAEGMGKTRLAAELAAEAHRAGADVRYAAGGGPPEAALAAVARTRAARAPALLVADDADRMPAALQEALRGLGRALVLATGEDAAALARLEPDEAFALAPLDGGAVAAIAALYAPAGRSLPVDALLAASGGVPRRVHEAASEWARREASRRVDAAAGRAAQRRSEARSLDAELAGSVAELQAARERAPADGGPPASVCPYKGLASFEADDADYFFGRERLVAEVVARLVGTPLLAVVGPSGSGKSSVVRAGLLPALAGGVLPGSEHWAQAVIRPGAHPLRELWRARRRLDGRPRGILVVDQLEELFTACRDEEERRAFAAALAEADGVVLVVRADFYGRCAAYPELAERMGANHVLVGPMARDELARAIERPAERAGLSVEPDLVDALLGDVEGRPGALPLLSTALLELWRERDGRRLRLAAYVRSGGVQGAVARLAEDAFVRLDPEQQVAARRLLLRLTDEDESGALVRRRVPLAELGDADVVSRLADRRLLTVGDGAVEPAHEALLREWPRLRGWLDEDAEGRRLQRRLAAAARAWQAGEGELYRGARLAGALDWASGHDAELNSAERAFLAAGRRAATRAHRRLVGGLAGAAALALAALVAGAVALQQRRDARAQATAAAAQSLGAQALAEGDLARALLLARQGVALHDSPQTRGNLLATLLKSPAAVGVISAGGPRFTALDLSPDGRTLALTTDDGVLRFVDARTHRATGRPQALVNLPAGPPDGVLRYSPDGGVVGIGGSGPQVIGARSHMEAGALGLRGGQTLDRIAFSPDLRTAFAILESSVPALIRIDLEAAVPVRAQLTVGRVPGAVALGVTPQGEPVTSRAGLTAIRDPRTLQPVRTFAAGAATAALSPDAGTLLLGDGDGAVRFLDLRSGRVRSGSGRHDGAVVRAAFSADGRVAATAGEDNRVIVWDAGRAAPRETLSGHTGRVTGLAFAPDGRTLYSAALDGETLVWDLAGDRRLDRPFAAGPPQPAHGRTGPQTLRYALSPDGRRLATGHDDGTVTVIDVRTLREATTFRAVPAGAVRSLAYLPGGALAVGGDAGRLALAAPGRGARAVRLPGPSGPVIRIAAGGRRLAALGAGGSVALWTLRAGRPVGPPRRLSADDISLSPDGTTLALASAAGVTLVDTATLRRRTTLAGSQTVNWLGPFTPDGRAVAAGGFGGWAQLWSVAGGRPTTPRLGGHSGPAPWQAVSPDGRTLATGGTDGTVRLFDLRTRQPLGAPLPGLPNRAVAPVFTPDGGYLLAVTDAGRGYRWDVRPAAWTRHACAVAGRSLSRAEWAQALPGRPYAPAC